MPILPFRPVGAGPRARFRALAVLGAVLAIALGGALRPLSAQSSRSSAAKSSAAQAHAAKESAAQAAQEAAEAAARAAEAERATAEAARAAERAAAQAEASRQAALKAQAEREAEAAELARRAAEAEASKQAALKAAEREATRAQEEEARRLAAEAAELKKASERAEAEKARGQAAAAALEQQRQEAERVAAVNAQVAEQAKNEAAAARAAAAESHAASRHASEAARGASEHAEKAVAAEEAYDNARNDAEKQQASLALEQASHGAEKKAEAAATHSQGAGEAGEKAGKHSKQAQAQTSLLAPLPLPVGQTAMTSRNWLLCGGGYAGWTGPGLCGAVQLTATTPDPGTQATTIIMRVRNLSGLFQSYAGSVLTGIGLSFLATDPRNLGVTGPCEPSLPNAQCADRWKIALGTHAKMPNGIGPVGMKITTHRILGGIASTCASVFTQQDAGGPVQVPVNPNGLYTNECLDENDWITFGFTATAPVDFTHTQLSLRAQNGYPNGEGSTACIYSGDDDSEIRDNDCMPVTTTPEPVSLVLLGSGLAGIGGVLRRRRNNTAGGEG